MCYDLWLMLFVIVWVRVRVQLSFLFSFLFPFPISGHLCLLYIFACCFIRYNILVAFVVPAGRQRDIHMFTVVCQSKGMWDMPYVCIYNKGATRNDSKCLSLAVSLSLSLCMCVCSSKLWARLFWEGLFLSPSLSCLAINVRRIFLNIKATIFSWKLHILWRRAK